MDNHFFNRIDKETYTARRADSSWKLVIKDNVDVKGKNAADIGSGGGIYSIALAEMGAKKVIGVDISENMLAGAIDNCRDFNNILFQVGTAQSTNLETDQSDIVLERALIHHLKENELEDCFIEAKRVLNENGVLIIQDRTKEDCVLKGDTEHIRGIFFDIFPELIEKDTMRRHSADVVSTYLKRAGFRDIKAITFWENRRTYESIVELKGEIISRKGRSILFELNEEQIHCLADEIEKRVENQFPLTEKERWTIWFAIK
ncbi:MAG: class I SAM-dependent methyltransferase [Bacillota bacterium]|nr:class I SAM-dependent methyltransferase [Bacillota bacterium]